MRFFDAVRLALQTIRAQKLKSGFSIIGVFIGVMFLIAVVSVVEGMNRYMTDKFAGTLLGVNTFRVRQFPDVQLGNVTDSMWRTWTRRPRITYEDAQAVMQGITVPVLAGWESTTRAAIVAGRRQVKDVQVTAATELYFDIRALVIEEGRAFTGQEVEAGMPVLVLGHELAEKLFEGQDPIGREVKIFDIPYRVIGVVEKQGNLFGISLDKFAVAPATAPLKRFVNPPRVVDAVAVKANSQAEMRLAMTQAEAVLASRRPLRPRQADDFALETADEVLDFWGKISAILQYALPFLPGISLVVGGIVIINMMFIITMPPTTSEMPGRKGSAYWRMALILPQKSSTSSAVSSAKSSAWRGRRGRRLASTASACVIASRISAWELAFTATASTTRGGLTKRLSGAVAGATANLSSEMPNRLPCFSTTPITR